MSGLLFLDTETTGLDLTRHDIWEIGFAVDHEPIISGFIGHSLANADPEALTVNRYAQRIGDVYPADIDNEIEDTLYNTCHEWKRRTGEPLVVVGANPQFDMHRLTHRWGGEQPWHYRAIDVSVYAMPILGHERPQGLATIADELEAKGFAINRNEETAHTAAADVAVTRNCYYALVLANAAAFRRN